LDIPSGGHSIKFRLSAGRRNSQFPRKLVYGYELTPAKRSEFDYYEGEELDAHAFVRYIRSCRVQANTA
jgi:hypothetical protein